MTTTNTNVTVSEDHLVKNEILFYSICENTWNIK